MRHGISIDSDAPSAPDDDAARWLTPKGEQRTRQAAEGLKQLGVDPAIIFTSTLLRAQQSAEIVAHALGISKNRLQQTKALDCFAKPTMLRPVLKGLKVSSALCVGHAPNLNWLIARLLRVEDRERFALKKAGAACFELGDDPWEGGSALIWLMPPKALRMISKA